MSTLVFNIIIIRENGSLLQPLHAVGLVWCLLSYGKIITGYTC